MRPRKSVSVSSIVGSPEEEESRPSLRLRIVGVIVVVLFGVLVLRLWTLQVVEGKSFATAVSQNDVRTVSLPAPRGEIVDRNGTVLADNQTVEEVFLSQVTAKEDPSVIGAAAGLVNETPTQVNQALNNPQFSPYEPVPILNDAPASVVDFYEENESEFPGVSIEQETQRSYPQNTPGNPVATAILGYVSPISGAELKANSDAGYTQASQYGQSGLENEYESYLRGTPGREAIAVNSEGQEVGTDSKTDPIQGDTVVTNIDLGLQEAVQSALASDIAADKHTADPTTGQLPSANDGAAVVLDAQTGAILAMASYPTYDPSVWVGGISDANYFDLSAGCNTTSSTTGCPLLNYAINGLYTPGSTFKLNTATAALDVGVINANTYVDDTGTYTIKDCTASCTYHDDEAADAGEIDMQSALTESDDYYFYNLGALFYGSANSNGIQDTAAAYGLGHPTGIDLPNESGGQVDSAALRQQQHKEDPGAFPDPGYYVGSNVEMAFGQGETLVTPIQNALAYATFANGGTRYQPQVAAAIVSPQGKVIKQFAPKVTGTVRLPASTYQPMLAGFEGVVSSPKGTGYTAFQQYGHFPQATYPVAGKTGTADVGPNKEPNAWFVGFGPTNHAANQPEYVVAVVVDHGGYGAQAAAPAVANIFNYLYANPVGPVQLPSASHQPSTTPPATVPSAGTPASTTTTISAATK